MALHLMMKWNTFNGNVNNKNEKRWSEPPRSFFKLVQIVKTKRRIPDLLLLTGISSQVKMMPQFDCLEMGLNIFKTSTVTEILSGPEFSDRI